MPVIRIPLERLERLTGFKADELEELLFRLKCESDLLDDGTMEIEVNPDRPDMLIGEGIARAVKGIARIEVGYKPLETRASGMKIIAGSVPSRPYIAAAVVRNVDIDEDYLVELIQFQEKLHATFGRKRRKAAIGFHDTSKLPSMTLYYREEPVDSVSFRPLGAIVSLRAKEILEKTEQGRVYGRISLREGRHPFLYSGKDVIAMPPVINSELTRVEPGTRDVFIDVTGTDERTVTGILDVIVSNLAERPRARVETVEIVYEARSLQTPLLEEKRETLDPGYVGRVLGVSLDASMIVESLEAMRYHATLSESQIEVTVPPYRLDVFGPVDLVEDVAISIGYDKLGVRVGWPIIRGGLLDETRLARKLAELMVGLGFIEVAQLTLTGPSSLSGLEGLMPGGLVEIENPVALEYSVLRPSLLVSLLQVAQANLGAQKPVKVFELGHAVYVAGEGSVVEDLRLAAMVMDYKAGYEDIQAPMYAVLERLGLKPGAEEHSVPVLIPGRTAKLKAGNVEVGVMGEVQPGILVSRGIEYPVAVAELSLKKLLEALEK